MRSFSPKKYPLLSVKLSVKAGRAFSFLKNQGVLKANPLIRRNVQVTNVSALSYGLLCFVLGLVYVALDFKTLSVISFAGAFFTILGPILLNHFGFVNLSRFLLSAIGGMLSVITSIENDYSSMASSCLVLCAVAPFALFKMHEKKLLLTSLSVPFAGYLTLIAGQFQEGFVHNAPHNSHTFIIELLYVLIACGSVVITVYSSISTANQAIEATNEAQGGLILNAKLASLGTAAAAAAHEMSNCLNFMNGSVRSLKRLVEEEVDIERRERAEKTLAVFTQGLKMSLDILGNLRGHSHVRQTDHSHVDLRVAINGVVQMLNPKSLGCDISISIEGHGIAYGNETGINQSILNLISNAVDAVNSGANTKLITVSVVNVIIKEYGGITGVEIKVKDTGPGIPEAIQEKIFNPFFTTKSTKDGTGLGLFISKKEITASNGTLSVRSAPGQGSEFVIVLPSAPLDTTQNAA